MSTIGLVLPEWSPCTQSFKSRDQRLPPYLAGGRNMFTRGWLLALPYGRRVHVSVRREARRHNHGGGEPHGVLQAIEPWLVIKSPSLSRGIGTNPASEHGGESRCKLRGIFS